MDPPCSSQQSYLYPLDPKRGERLPVTETLGKYGTNLPTYNAIKDNDLERVVTVARNFIRKG
jgi:dTDP-4-amino-4,6-dideoxygalactose transaminase